MAQIYETRITDEQSNLFARFVSVPARSVQNLRYLEHPALLTDEADLRMLGDLTLETLIPSLINLLYLSEDPHRFEEFASETPALFFGPTETRWHTAVNFDLPSMEKYWNAASRLAFQPIPFEASPLSGVPLGSLFTLSATSYGLAAGYMVGAIVAGPALGILLTGPLGAVIGYFGAALARGAARPTEALGEQQAAKLLRLLVPDFVYGDASEQDERSGEPKEDK